MCPVSDDNDPVRLQRLHDAAFIEGLRIILPFVIFALALQRLHDAAFIEGQNVPPFLRWNASGCSAFTTLLSLRVAAVALYGLLAEVAAPSRRCFH